MGVEEYKNALAACVLWLIPGVPLINGFIDMLTGYMVSGMAKLAYALMLVFMISIGFLSLFICLLVMNFFDAFGLLAERIFWSMWVSVGFALLFNTPRRALWATALLGAVGWSIKFLLIKTIIPDQVVIASFVGACSVGF